jgi:hypothetical protein
VQLIEFADNLKASAIGTKEHVARRGKTDLLPFVVANRGDKPIALVTIHEHVRDTILSIAGVMATGLDADSVGIVFESYVTVPDPEHPERDGLNPVTGQRWKANEMHLVATVHDGIAKGWIEESIGVVVANRAGDLIMLSLPFHYTSMGHLKWDEPKAPLSTLDMPKDGKVSGIMPEAMIRMMIEKSAMQMFPDFPHDEHERDAFVAQLLTMQGNAVMLYADIRDTKRVATLQRRNPGGHFRRA